jgi:hypothetical protein
MVHQTPDQPVIPEADAFAAASRDLAPMEFAADPGSAQVALSRDRSGRDDG